MSYAKNMNAIMVIVWIYCLDQWSCLEIRLWCQLRNCGFFEPLG